MILSPLASIFFSFVLLIVSSPSLAPRYWSVRLVYIWYGLGKWLISSRVNLSCRHPLGPDFASKLVWWLPAKKCGMFFPALSHATSIWTAFETLTKHLFIIIKCDYLNENSNVKWLERAFLIWGYDYVSTGHMHSALAIYHYLESWQRSKYS